MNKTACRLQPGGTREHPTDDRFYADKPLAAAVLLRFVVLPKGARNAKNL